MPADNPKSSDRGFFAIFVATLALMISMGAMLAVAFKLNDTESGAATTAAAHPAAEEVKLVVKSDTEHGRQSPDGNWHDAFLPASFSVKPGALVRVTVYNYDDATHSFTAPGLGTNVTIAGGSESEPATTTFTFRAPQKAGRYEWFCAIPCDPWAMNAGGFMRGFVTVA